MPLYEYQCTKCGHRFEVIQKFSDPPKKKCPKCGSPVEKLISSPAIHFKGAGWYVTDYGKGNAAGSNTKPPDKPSGGEKDSSQSSSSSSSSSSTDKPKTESKSDSKPESKPEPKQKGKNS